jgi:PAS domain S-box-containing protein/putative nucleotidyltransferase with HDIG domain
LEIVGVARDITENMRSENALRESEEKYRQLVEGAPNGIIVYEYNRITYANPAAVALLRAGAESDLLGIPPLSLVHPIDREAVLQRMKAARTSAAVTTLNHEKWFGFDGRIIDVEVKAIPISSQGDGAIQLIIQDINERLQAEQAIRESEERFRAVVQTANDAIITMDQTGKIVSWNFAAENIFHYSPGQIIGLPISCIVPDQAKILRQPGSADQNQAGKIVEVSGLSREGKEFPIEMSITDWKARGGDFFTVIIRDITERKQRENELRVIASLSAALRTARSRTELLSVAVNHMNSQLQYGSIATEIINHETRESVIEAASGAWESLAGSRQAISQGPNFILRGTTPGQNVDKSRRETSAVVHTEAGDQIIEGVGIPLVAQEQLIGMLWVGKSQEIPESEEHLLASIADIIANALLRTTLHEQTLKDALEITHAYDTTLEGWAHALELRDQETVVHSQNVVEMTIELARVMGVAENEIDNVRRGALLHDIGKMGIPDSVLLKPGTLNEREWEIMRRHPEYGYKLLEPIEYLLPAIDIPYCHHERWDGTGYPRGLQAEEIPLVARIFAIVDVWDALLTDRPYRKAWDIDQACRYLQDQAGKHFDPQVVDAFMHSIVEPMQPPAQ